MNPAGLHNQVLDALDDVHDPHVPASLREMGMLDSVEVDGHGDVCVRVCVPCLACPGGSQIEEQITRRLARVAGVGHVRVELGWHLPWDRADIGPGTRELMRAHGIQV